MKNLILIFCLFAVNIFPQRANPDFWVATATAGNPGSVFTIAVDGNNTYVGGDFTYIGPNTGHGCKLTAGSNLPNMSFPKVNGIIYCAVPDGSGGWYIGGEFSKVGKEFRNNIARINSDGTVNAWNPSAEGIINTIVIRDSSIYVGGYFQHIGDQYRTNIAKLNLTTGEADTMWNANISEQYGGITTIAVTGSDIYVGGRFTSIGGQARSYLAKLNNTTGQADVTWNPNPTSPIFCAISSIAVSGSDIYVAGRFSLIGGQIRNCIAKLNNITGDADITWNPNPISPTYGIATIAVSGSDIYVGGDFTSIGGQPRNNIAKINNTTGEADLTWNPYANDRVAKIVVDGADIYIGGNFTSIGGHDRNYLAKIDNITGEPDTTWNPNSSGPVVTLAVNGSDIYVGGLFYSIGGQNRYNIAKLNNLTGEVDRAWTANSDGSVYTIFVNGSDIYVGGNFSSISGQPRGCIAKLNNTTGIADVTWKPNFWGGSVSTIVVNNSDIYIGGKFFS